MPKRFSIIFALLSFILPLGIPPSGHAESQAANLKNQLEALTTTHGITIKNSDLILDTPPIKVTGSIKEQLNQLLSDYNFVQLTTPQGSIEKIIIMGVKSYNQPQPIVTAVPKNVDVRSKIQTTRSGYHHLVKTELSGPNGATITLSLLIDTGATTIVLPASFQNALGFSEQNLQSGTSETANGRIDILHGMLKSVTVGNATAQDIEVSFLPDDKLQANGLLGMSFLGRFQLTFDDALNQITLKPSPRPD